MRKWLIAGTMAGLLLELVGTGFACKGLHCYFMDDWRAFGFFWGGVIWVVVGMIMATNFVNKINALDDESPR